MQVKDTNPKVILRRFYTSIILVLFILIGIIGYSYYIGNRMITNYHPLIDASMEIKLEATRAHLWFEEIISGDRHERIEHVWKHIDQADWYAKAMLEGGENKKGLFIPLDDTVLSKEITEVRTKIKEFREITKKRYTTIKPAQAGTAIDKKYDAVFRDFIQQADEVETKLQQIMAADLSKYKRIQIGLFILVSIIVTSLIAIFIYLEKVRSKDYNAIVKANADLEKEAIERKQAQENLKESETKNRDLIKFMPLPLCLASIDGKTEYVNNRFTETFGYTIEDIPNVGDWLIKAYPDEKYREWVLNEWAKAETQAITNNTDIESVAYNITCKSGIVRTIIISGTTISNGFLTTFMDISERVMAEKEIKNLNENLEALVKDRTSELNKKAFKLHKSQQALTFLLEDVNDIKKQLVISNSLLSEANKELGAFSYSVSHDLKAPLRAVIGFSKILLEDFEPQLDSDSKRYIGLIIDNAENMGALINELLNFSRLGRKEIQKSKVDLSDIVQRVKGELLDGVQGREISINTLPMPTVSADEHLMYHVMLNLISNAVKFTSKVENAIVEIGYTEKNDENVFYFKDNGVGFNMKYSSKIFDVFQRLHTVEEFPGTGIGLSIVQRIIHKHRGRIWVESELNNGTTLFFTL